MTTLVIKDKLCLNPRYELIYIMVILSFPEGSDAFILCLPAEILKINVSPYIDFSTVRKPPIGYFCLTECNNYQ